MTKTILYRLFRLGRVPKKLRPVLDQEGVIIMDEGIPGRFVTTHVDAPGKRYRHRREGFSGCLAVTNKRFLCYTYGKRQINICVEDPMMAHLYVEAPEESVLRLSFDSARFREGWVGVIQYRFNTDKAHQFRDALMACGARHGTAADAGRVRRGADPRSSDTVG